MATKKKAPERTSPKTCETVGRVMHEFKEGTLRSGGDGKKVTSRKQAIAIGLSEARAEETPAPAKRARAKRATVG